MKIEDFISLLFYYIIVITMLLVLVSIVNKNCNQCLYKDDSVMLNPQGYAYDIEHNNVSPYDVLQQEGFSDIKQPKARFNKEKTTGFMTVVQENVNPRTR